VINLLAVWLLSAAAIHITATLTPGFKIRSFGAAMLASVVLGLLNMTIRPLLLFLTLPINILTLGLFTIVINAVVLRLTAGLLKGFDISGWLPAILGAIVLALVQAFLFWVLGPTSAEIQQGVTV